MTAQICARCEHLTTGAQPGASQGEIDAAASRAAAGIGQCTGFLAAINSFVPWDGEKCGLYRAAKKAAPREKWIEKMEMERK